MLPLSEAMMSHYPTSSTRQRTPSLDEATYQQWYQQSIIDGDGFWREHGHCIDWFTDFNEVQHCCFEYGHVDIQWYLGSSTNACYNCIDRHLPHRAEQIAIHWVSDDGHTTKQINYQELHEQVCRFANGLKSQGVRQGDVVTLYMPMVIGATVAILACARIGAVHSVVFGGFSAQALAERIGAAHSKVVVTANHGVRGGKKIAFKATLDEALALPEAGSIETVIVLQNHNGDTPWQPNRDVWWHELTTLASVHCNCREMDAQAPLFILYTSGSTGIPKGVLHATGGYLVYACTTFKYIFDYQEGDVYWCNADVGWITGHSYVIYGPLLNGATIVMHEGVPNYPAINQLARIVDQLQVNILYTAPTAIRMLMAHGDAAIEQTSRQSLRVLGSVGEPINPEAWRWYHDTIGNGNCPIMDTWWQTETGGVLITPLYGATTLKPGSATRPFFGIQPALMDDDGRLLEGEASGHLVILNSWPGQARSLYNDHPRFMEVYFKPFRGVYTTGDGAHRDADGYYWITGRMDDVLNVAGHRLGTAEVESALVAYPEVAEAAVVGVPDDVKGEAMVAFVTLKHTVTASQPLAATLQQQVRSSIGGFAQLQTIYWARGLPKTRSGKIMRRILRKIAVGDASDLGDISTLAEPDVVARLITPESGDVINFN